MFNMHSVWIVVVAALVTMATRFLPFLIFGNGRKAPAVITRLGQVLPFAIMGMLVVYCMKDVSFLSYPHGIPELLGCGTVAVLHLWRRNSLLSIGVGTVFYMVFPIIITIITFVIIFTIVFHYFFFFYASGMFKPSGLSLSY